MKHLLSEMKRGIAVTRRKWVIANANTAEFAQIH